MYEYHDFRVSRYLLAACFAFNTLAALVILLYCSATLLKWSSLAALCLLGFSEYRHLIRHGIIRLRIVPRHPAIELERLGQSYFYRKYKVYQTRWFAILKLTDHHNSRTLILIPDSFKSLHSYRRLRQQIRQLEHSDAT